MAKMKTGRNEKGWIRSAGQVCLCLLFLCVPCSAEILHNVNLVVSSDAGPYREAAEALESALAEQNVATRLITLEAIIQREPSLSLEKKTEVWVAIGSRAADYLNFSLPDSVSLVYCMVADPEKIGLKSGRKKVVGVSVTTSVNEQFAIIRQAMPNLLSIGMLYRTSSAKSVQTLDEVLKHLPSSWQLEAVDVDAAGSMAVAIQKLVRKKVGMIWTMADSSIYTRATVKALLLASLRNQTPVFGFSGSFVKAGALLGLDADPRLQGQYAASLVQDILSQSKKQSQSATPGVTLAVNLIVADRLGISLPEEIIGRAHVIGQNK
ncbi:MAG: hypothetical protein KKC77_05750 [Proteobacteria bacterium]|nr:hypothetical protein [Pseudomonadota bacterium]